MKGEDQLPPTKKNRLTHDIMMFLLGPLAFLILVRFTGYQIFYNGDPSNKERKRMVFLLSSGALFYLLIIIIVSLTS
jgi:hypothetical protein